jgi:V-type H+-transporting ATPase subunit a
MFGDVGHGGIVLLIGLILCGAEPYIRKNEDFQLLLRMRYMIVLMGFFATYMGFIYNDFMSLPLNFFGKGCYKLNQDKSDYVLQDPECVYPFGFDPVWMSTKVDITYFNSFKMKTSVIYGVAQMSLGIIIKGVNAKYFGRDLDFYHEFIP